MAEVPPTRPSLLVRMRDAHDQQAWADFVRLYAPAIYRFARRKGLQDADASDLTQEVLRSVAGSIGQLFVEQPPQFIDARTRRHTGLSHNACGFARNPYGSSSATCAFSRTITRLFAR